MDLALDTLPVETATVLATDAEAWVMADMIVRLRAKVTSASPDASPSTVVSNDDSSIRRFVDSPTRAVDRTCRTQWTHVEG